MERSTSPPNGPVSASRGGKGGHSHHPLIHTVSTPNLDPILPKTYVSISSYTSETEGCLSFNEGDRCVLIQQNKEGWWLVNIGGREGWTPGEYWKEDTVSGLDALVADFESDNKLTKTSISRKQCLHSFT